MKKSQRGQNGMRILWEQLFYCFVVPDAGGPGVFCSTRLNDSIAAGDRLEKTKRLSKEDGIERVGHLDAIRHLKLASDPARSRATS